MCDSLSAHANSHQERDVPTEKYIWPVAIASEGENRRIHIRVPEQLYFFLAHESITVRQKSTCLSESTVLFHMSTLVAKTMR
jgi:hypothetical protein